MTAPTDTREPVIAAAWIRAAAARMRRARLHFGHGTTTAEEEAIWLLSHACRLKPIRLIDEPGFVVARAARLAADQLLGERIRSRAPAAYLMKEAWLDGRRFYVDERTIVPRSFIAEILHGGLDPWLDGTRVEHVMDLCTGSGCLAILAARRFPSALVDGIDISAQALDVAAINVRRHRLLARVKLHQSDLFASLPRRRYQLIISNPPYVDAQSMRTLPDEYRREPALALAGGKDGLSLVHEILERAPDYLAPHGLLVVEIGHNRKVLEKAYPKLPFTWLETAVGEDFVFCLTRQELVQGLVARRR